MPRIGDWANNRPYNFDRRARAVPQEEGPPVTGLYFRNHPDTMRVMVADTKSGKVLEIADDIVVFVVINAAAAEHIRDDLLMPHDFPEKV